MPAISKMSPWNRFARRLNLTPQEPHGDRFLKLAAEARARIQELPAAEAAKLVENDALLIDVRERGEYAQRHAASAEHLSRGVIELEIERYAPDPATPIVCYCSGGNRSALVADNLQRMGYTHVRVVAGGLRAWIDAGLPTASEKEFID